jgi:hypothetical protein
MAANQFHVPLTNADRAIHQETFYSSRTMNENVPITRKVFSLPGKYLSK